MTAHEIDESTYLVCRCCGHVEAISPDDDDLGRRCENCRRRACLALFDDHDQALDFSDEILERNKAYEAFKRGEMEHGW